MDTKTLMKYMIKGIVGSAFYRPMDGYIILCGPDPVRWMNDKELCVAYGRVHPLAKIDMNMIQVYKLIDNP